MPRKPIDRISRVLWQPGSTLREPSSHCDGFRYDIGDTAPTFIKISSALPLLIIFYSNRALVTKPARWLPDFVAIAQRLGKQGDSRAFLGDKPQRLRGSCLTRSRRRDPLIERRQGGLEGDGDSRQSAGPSE